MIHYTARALSDLIRLRKFIAEKNPTVASRISSELKQEINKLDIFSQIGVEVTSAQGTSKVRDLFIANYTIRYLIANENIFILRLWHNKENERNN